MYPKIPHISEKPLFTNILDIRQKAQKPNLYQYFRKNGGFICNSYLLTYKNK